MVTGDNILTAVSVSQNCGLVHPGDKLIRVSATLEHNVPTVQYHLLTDNQVQVGERRLDMENSYLFVLDGATFRTILLHFRTELLPYIVRRGAVFARMRPDMKQQLVELLQDLGYYVGMCGDGANDCGALKAAHSGISLSEAEASVASPFTSQIPDISCVPLLIQEGRAALVTSFGIFKYMAAYSITQFVSVMILYDIYANLADVQYLYIDLFIITSLAAVFGFNKAYDGPLANSPPGNSLISPLPLFSLFCQLSIVVGFQVGALFVTKAQPWFAGFDYENSCYNGTIAEQAFINSGLIDADKCTADDDPVASYENYAIFSVSQFQYIILAIAFSKGTPYRKNMFTNIPLLLFILVLTLFSVYLTLGADLDFLHGFFIQFELFHPPKEEFSFRLLLLGLVAANCLLCLFCESVVSDGLVRRLQRSRNQIYDLLEKELINEPTWPPLSSTTSGSPRPSTRDSPQRTLVEITGKGLTDPTDAFESLFSTPASISHSSAAVYLNPPPAPSRVDTPHQTPLSPPGTNSSSSTSKFASCDSTPVVEHGRGDNKPCPSETGETKKFLPSSGSGETSARPEDVSLSVLKLQNGNLKDGGPTEQREPSEPTPEPTSEQNLSWLRMDALHDTENSFR